MAVAVIADSHLGGPGGAAGPLIAQLRDLPGQGCRRLLLLGDIFHVWVGFPSFETEEVRQLLPVLAELRAAGIEVDYVEGNRDFFLGEGPYAGSFDRLATEIAFEADGVRYLAVHGDGLNDRDRKYRFWRWLSKSAGVRLLVKRLPATVAKRLVGSTEARLSRSNFKHKMHVPEAPIRSWASRRLAEGHQVILLGHFHAPYRWAVDDGEVRVLDAWFNSRQVEWLAPPQASEDSEP